MTIIEKINEGIKGAMRNRDQLRLATLRMLKSKILSVDARGNLPDPDVVKLFKTYFGNLKEALIYNGVAPLMHKSLTVPLTARSPILPPGKKSGVTTKESAVKAILLAGISNTA